MTTKYRKIIEALETLKPDKEFHISISDFEDPDKFYDILNLDL